MSTNKKKKPQINLNGKQNKYLRGLGHHVDPVVYVGKEGISENVVQSVLDALRTRELIKVKLGQNCEVPKKEAAELLSEASGASLVQLIGKMVVGSDAQAPEIYTSDLSLVATLGSDPQTFVTQLGGYVPPALKPKNVISSYLFLLLK